MISKAVLEQGQPLKFPADSQNGGLRFGGSFWGGMFSSETPATSLADSCGAPRFTADSFRHDVILTGAESRSNSFPSSPD